MILLRNGGESDAGMRYIFNNSQASPVDLTRDQWGLADINLDGSADFWWFDQSQQEIQAYTLTGHNYDLAVFDATLTEILSQPLGDIMQTTGEILSIAIRDFNDDGDSEFLIKTATDFYVFEGIM